MNRVIPFLLIILLAACDQSCGTPGSGPTGAGGRTTPLMQPFQGPWNFDSVNPNDPDITTMPPTAGSATMCGADGAPAAAWTSWRTYVFLRG